MRSILFVVVCTALPLLAACSGAANKPEDAATDVSADTTADGPADSRTTCVPGESWPCGCMQPGCEGVQTCGDEGSEMAPCVCECDGYFGELPDAEGESVAPSWDDGVLVAMTFNVMCSMCSNDEGGNEDWEHRVPHIGDVIARYSPDLVGLQELMFGTEVEQVLEVAPGYQALFPKDLTPNVFGLTEEPDAVILFRADRFSVQESGFFWLSETPDTDWSGGWATSNLPRVVLWAKLKQTTDGRELYFASTHFDNNYPNQEMSAPLVLDRLGPWAEGYPLVLVGDFNSKPDSVAYSTLTQGVDGKGFHFLNAFDLAETWSAVANLEPPPSYDPDHRIDHIFMAGTPTWGCAWWKVDQFVYGEKDQYPSDHFAMAASLVW